MDNSLSHSIPRTGSAYRKVHYSDVVGSNDPQTAEYGLFLCLYSNDGDIEIFIAEKDYTKTSGVTQPEINRIVQSLHRTEAKVASATTN